MKIALLVGARPNYMKVGPIHDALARWPEPPEQLLIHTGQHYDEKMSDAFFRDLELPRPDVALGVGSGTHAEQTAKVMLALEPVLLEHRPDVLVVVGDVNSTLAGALTAVKLGIRTAHVEAGLRSRDRAMPEEINRIATDAISDLFLTTCREAGANLLAEGHSPEKIHFVGNTMIDSLTRFLPKAEASGILTELGLAPREYLCVTLHRPSNVDDENKLRQLLETLQAAAEQTPVVFPAHPRTQQRMQALGWSLPEDGRFRVLEPLGYLDFLRLMSAAAVVITDSGGIQEETSYLGIPCLTVRENTERPVTVTEGTNRLVACAKPAILEALADAAARIDRPAPRIELWDGKAGERIADVLLSRG